MEYPDILDYFLSLVQIGFPADHDDVVKYPPFASGAPLVAEQRKVKSRRDSMTTEHRKKEKRRG